MMIGPLRIHTLVALLTVVLALVMIALLTRRKRERGGESVAADGSFVLPRDVDGAEIRDRAPDRPIREEPTDHGPT